MLRMSTLFLRTLRDDPADAEVPSHRLLVRAGYIRRIAAGIYSWLPLGLITYRNIENIIRDEMDKAGFKKFTFPLSCPANHMKQPTAGQITGHHSFACKTERVEIIY
jgi:prolyl-tRNA synthetase